MPEVPESPSLWTCPQCRRSWRLQGPAAAIAQCPLCAPASPPTTGERSAAPATSSSAGFPGLSRQAWTAASALARFVADGCRTITLAAYQQRLSVCEACDRQSRGRCQECGCWIAIKARGRAWNCPLNRWPHEPAGDNPTEP